MAEVWRSKVEVKGRERRSRSTCQCARSKATAGRKERQTQRPQLTAVQVAGPKQRGSKACGAAQAATLQVDMAAIARCPAASLMVTALARGIQDLVSRPKMGAARWLIPYW